MNHSRKSSMATATDDDPASLVELINEFVDVCKRYLLIGDDDQSSTPQTTKFSDDMFEKIEEITDLTMNSSNGKECLSAFLRNAHIVDTFCSLLQMARSSVRAYLISDTTSSSSSGSSKEKHYQVKVFFHLTTLIRLIWYLSNFSVDFRQRFHERNGTKHLLSYLQDASLVKYCIETETIELDLNEPTLTYLADIFGSSIIQLELNSFLISILGTLHNISKSDLTQTDLNELTETLLAFSSLVNSLGRARTCLIMAYMTLALTLTDREIDELKDINEIVAKLMQLIERASTAIAEGGKALKRSRIELESAGKFEQVCMVGYEDLDMEFDLVELISSLYHIAVNDKIKHFIYFDCDAKVYIERIVRHGNGVEKEYALKLLYQLSFDKSIVESIRNEKSLVRLMRDLIKSIENNNSNKNENVLKYCKGILFVTENKFQHPNVVAAAAAVPFSAPASREFSGGSIAELARRNVVAPPKAAPQIMISYNFYSRNLCMRIKRELEKLGFSIWIDVESIHGSSLESMAKAIETSDCILICMTERYKLSPNCRAEAEYTFNIGKPFIPLKMQENYKPDGWLGFVLGAKIYIDFAKYEFEESFGRLKHELKAMISIDQDQHSSPAIQANKNPQEANASSSNDQKPTAAAAAVRSNIEKMTIDEVKSWLTEVKCNSLETFLDSFDGSMLKELLDIRNESVDAFLALFTTMNNQTEKKISSSDLIRFSIELKKLQSK